MVKYKVGDDISDEDGWRSVEEIGRDGVMIVANEDGQTREEYNADNDMTRRWKGWMVKMTGNPKWTAYSYRLFNRKSDAKKYAIAETERLEKIMKKPQYYRVVPANLKHCRTCGDIMLDDGDFECLRCEKIRDDARHDFYPEEMEVGR